MQNRPPAKVVSNSSPDSVETLWSPPKIVLESPNKSLGHNSVIKLSKRKPLKERISDTRTKLKGSCHKCGLNQGRILNEKDIGFRF